MIKRHSAAPLSDRQGRSRGNFGAPAYLEALEPRQLMAADLYGNTPDAAEIVAGTLGTSQVTFADAVNATDTKDFFKVHLGANQILNASLTGLSANANLRVYNLAGELVASSANAGTANENLRVALAQNTDYYVLVCRGTGDTTYTLKLSATATVADGAGNTRGKSADLGTLASGSTATATDFIGAEDTNDYYRFTLGTASNLELHLSGLSGQSQVDIQLLDSAGNVMSSIRQAAGETKSITATLAAGNYYLRVSRVAGESTYTALVTASNLSDSCGNSQSAARDIGAVKAAEGTYQDSLNSFDSCDYYTFVVPGDSKISINLTGLTADATLKLMDQTGKVVAYSVKAGTADESIAAALTAGVYYIRVNIDSGSTNYTLAASTALLPQSPVFSTDNGGFTPDTYGSYNDFRIWGTDGNDLIEISSSSGMLNIVINGHASSYPITKNGKTLDEIAVFGGKGDDTIVVTSSVAQNCRIYGEAGNDMVVARSKGHVTLVSIGGGKDKLIGNDGDTSFWIDSTDIARTTLTDIAAGHVHKVDSFYQPYSSNPTDSKYVPLELEGQDLPDPTTTDSSLATENLSGITLWGDGPSINDINQGMLGDCYFLASLGGTATLQPDRLRELAVDLGDGTFAVAFKREGVTSYVRVDADIVISGGMFAYNAAQNNGPIWACVMEKAYAFYREPGANSYASIEAGYANAVFSDLGFEAKRMEPRTSSEATFRTISTALAAGKPVVLGTVTHMPNGVPLVGNHAYTVLSASRDNQGNITYTMRNPWGWDGENTDTGEIYSSGDPNDGIVTLTADQVNAGCDNLMWVG